MACLFASHRGKSFALETTLPLLSRKKTGKFFFSLLAQCQKLREEKVRVIERTPLSEIAPHSLTRRLKVEILYNKEICNLQLKKRRFICLSSKFYYKSGQ